MHVWYMVEKYIIFFLARRSKRQARNPAEGCSPNRQPEGMPKVLRCLQLADHQQDDLRRKCG